ncbi:glyoxylase-like metal-dependent hydrolase (beta-lactamase superfamily II) [Sphaerotilus mobilis]|uniref:Glyoxylase-like metal-dependent hydrolase (Beta-lactamase superfamily II) n=1 Tax=Sphaerotilus mobilis TaxID=47994 RepID=A0A4Q7LLP4_9BURK|nr:glyoxylase-like metal-dependent hydrolase (beta-lactamase superfamily II) [Sphaerotilus mobilis]
MLGASLPPAAAAGAPDMPLQPVADRVWFVQGESAMGSAANQNFISNAGIVLTDTGVVVIDALGSPALAQRLIERIREITPLPIHTVIVTHYHADHIYGLQVFRDAGARLVAHARARDYIGSETAVRRLEASREELFPWIDEHTRIEAPDLWLGEGGHDEDVTLHIGGTDFVVRHAGPAHTPEDLIVSVPARSVLFSGDLVFRQRVPYVGLADSKAWIVALDRMLAFDPKVVVPGHGPVSNDPRSDLATTRDYLRYLRDAMAEAATNLEPFDEAYARVNWARFEKLPLFGAVNRMNAYNTYLLMEQEAR